MEGNGEKGVEVDGGGERMWRGWEKGCRGGWGKKDVEGMREKGVEVDEDKV